MSHTIKVVGQIFNLALLERACERLSYPKPAYVQNREIGDGSRATGYLVHIPEWVKPTVFNIETGDVYFDNYSRFDAKHAEVKLGRRQIGEEGQWGDIKKLWNLQDQYLAEVTAQAAQDLGDHIEWLQQEPGQPIEFLIHHQSA